MTLALQIHAHADHLTVFRHIVADVQGVDTGAEVSNHVLQPLDNTPKKPLNLLVKLSQVPKSHERPMQMQPEELHHSLSSLHQSPEKLRLMR